MTIAALSTTRFADVAEVTLGTLPTGPSWKIMEWTNFGLKPGKKTVMSKKMRSDRNVRGEYLVGWEPGGNLDFELSYGALDSWMESALMGSWTTNVLANANTVNARSIEARSDFGGGTYGYNRYLGSVANGMSLSLKAGEIITGSLDIFARSITNAATQANSSTYATASTTDSMTAATDFGALSLASTTMVSSVQLSELDIKVTNNLRRRLKLSSPYTVDFGLGIIEVTGSFKAYYESKEILDAVMAHEVGDLDFELGTTSGSKYGVHLNALQLLDAEVGTGGQNDECFATVQFRSVYHSGSTSSITINRAVT